MKRAEDLSMKIMAIILCVIALFCCFPQTADADVAEPLSVGFLEVYDDDGGRMENISSVAMESGEDTMLIAMESEEVVENEGGISSVVVAFIAFLTLIAVFLINIARDRKDKREEE